MGFSETSEFTAAFHRLTGENPELLSSQSRIIKGVASLHHHGSMQSAANYDRGAGWSTLADRYGFALLMPEQSGRNNLNRSFNWFQHNDTQREEGEAHSIVQMVEQMVRDHDIDRRRIFVTGLSAGGAMTLAMLATYPDVFAAGAVIAGLPYGGAANAQEALRCMFQAPPKSSRELGDLVREASPNRNIWPKLSVWHGSGDRTVKPSNAGEIIKQWLDVHGLPLTPMSDQIVDGHSRQVWWNANGETVIESYTITDMAHGTPLTHSEGGVAGPYMIEAGISSSAHIAEFFGLTDTLRRTPAETIELSRRAPLFGALRKATRSHRIRAVRAWRNVSAMLHESIGRRRANKEVHVRSVVKRR